MIKYFEDNSRLEIAYNNDSMQITIWDRYGNIIFIGNVLLDELLKEINSL